MSLPAFEAVPPEFGQPLPQKASTEVLEALFFRRSTPAPTLQAPGPSAQEMRLLVRIGLRVPDHGKIGPWRIVRFTPQTKTALVRGLTELAQVQPDPAKAVAALQKLSLPPEALMVVSSPIQPHKIPLWEQQLSAAAVCQNLLIAAGAMGYGANWITDWYSYDEAAKQLLGLTDSESVAGWILLGTASEAPLERDRPNYDDRISWWQG